MTTLTEIINTPGRYCLRESAACIDQLAESLWTETRVAVLDAPACMVNNLRVWENLILPAWYHHGGRLVDWEAPLAQKLTQARLDEAESQRLLASLPAMLSQDERRFLVLLRAVVLNPDVLLVDADWWQWLQRQGQDHPAHRLWPENLVCVVIGQRVPAEGFQLISI